MGVGAGGERYFTEPEAMIDDFGKSSGGVLNIDIVVDSCENFPGRNLHSLT